MPAATTRATRNITGWDRTKFRNRTHSRSAASRSTSPVCRHAPAAPSGLPQAHDRPWRGPVCRAGLRQLGLREPLNSRRRDRSAAVRPLFSGLCRCEPGSGQASRRARQGSRLVPLRRAGRSPARTQAGSLRLEMQVRTTGVRRSVRSVPPPVWPGRRRAHRGCTGPRTTPYQRPQSHSDGERETHQAAGSLRTIVVGSAPEHPDTANDADRGERQAQHGEDGREDRGASECRSYLGPVDCQHGRTVRRPTDESLPDPANVHAIPAEPGPGTPRSGMSRPVAGSCGCWTDSSRIRLRRAEARAILTGRDASILAAATGRPPAFSGTEQVSPDHADRHVCAAAGVSKARPPAAACRGYETGGGPGPASIPEGGQPPSGPLPTRPRLSRAGRPGEPRPRATNPRVGRRFRPRGPGPLRGTGGSPPP